VSARSKLVIVESPAKAKTIAKYLGDEFQVLASVGHIRDLIDLKDLPPELKKKSTIGRFAIDVDDDFKPYYAISPGKSKTVAELKAALKDADELYLATDEDREGEAIAWHLLDVLKPKVPVHRMVFHEITKEAIQAAVKNTRAIDDHLVEAQETRRVVDRLYGYEISPILWRKIQRGLSAGRVQSPAVRLVVERERERMAFVTASYFDIKGLFETDKPSEPKFEAKLFTYNGQRIATGESFNDKGELVAQVLLLDEDKANALADAIKASTSNVEVISVESKPSTRRPAAPFTTSTLQQEASRKLRMSAKQTMDVAQSLYQQGYITYMRTDSPTLSTQAINAARSQAKEMFGEEYVASAPRVYQGKNKNAQEAHEAIRPAGEIFRKPSEVAGEILGRTFELYDLIWKRTVASQMQDAKVSTTTAKIAVFPLPNGDRAEFTASGTVVTFRGFMAAYEESQDEPRNEDEENEEKESKLPNMEVGQKLSVLEINAKSHQTSPPPRYTEASLVKALEEDGIGRPSTYAAIISNIINKGYVTKRGQALVPEWIAFTVMRFLEDKVARLVDYEFTARMEEDLDEIANGTIDRSAWLKEFYFGSEGNPGLNSVVENIGEIDAKALNSLDLGDGITLRTGKFGPYMEIYIEPNAEGADENGRRIINIPEGLAPDELTLAKAHELIEAPVLTDRILGVEPVSGHNVLFKDGRYGPYVLLDDPDAKKPKTASLFKTMSTETMDLEIALKLLSLPRVVGQDAEGVDITTQNGKFGPYLLRAKDSRSLASEDLIFDLTLEGALELLAQPKLRGRVTAATPLKEFGDDPSAKTKVVAKSGQFGLYVTDGAINATVPKDEPLEELTSERAFELLAIRREKLGLEPGQAAPKVSKSRRAAAPARTVKKGTTRKKDK